jgi:hypothetical protein
MYLAMNWLIVEQLTLPDVFSEAERDELIARAVERIVTADETQKVLDAVARRRCFIGKRL